MIFDVQESKTIATVRVALHTGDTIEEFMDEILEVMQCHITDDFKAEIIEVNGTCEFTLRLSEE